MECARRAITSPRSSLRSRLGEPVTVFDENPRRCRKVLAALGLPLDSLRVIARRLPYRDYLAEMARHKIVLQADKSAVPGQVAGDALLCRMPCVGGDGAIDRLGFPADLRIWSFVRRVEGPGAAIAARSGILFRDRGRVAGQAREQVGYEAVARQLAQFFAQSMRPGA